MEKLRINDLWVHFSNHAEKRLQQRNISLKEIAWRLHDRYNTIKHYKYSDRKLIYKSKGFSLIFRIHGKTIVVVSVMNFENIKDDEEAVVI